MFGCCTNSTESEFITQLIVESFFTNLKMEELFNN